MLRLTNKNDEKIIYSSNTDYFMVYKLIAGTRSVGINGDCVGYDYLIIIDSINKKQSD